MRIAFVRQHPDIFRAAHFVNFLEFIVGYNGAARIARRIDDQHFRPGSDGASDHVGAEAKPVGRIGHHRHRRCAREENDIRIGDPVGCGNQNFVALFQQRAECIKERVLAADGHDAFRHRVGRAELRRVPFANRIAQRADAARRSVFCAPFLHRADRRALDVFGGWKVRLARTEVGEVHALGAEFFGSRQNSGGRRDGNAVNAGSELHGFELLWVKQEYFLSGACFSLRGLGAARTKPRKLKRAPRKACATKESWHAGALRLAAEQSS